MIASRLFVLLCYFQFCSSECKLTYVTKDGVIKNRDCFQWSEWSSCNDNGVRQRKRNSCGGIEKIEEEVCYPKFHATFAFLNGKSPPGGPRFELPKTSVEATNMNFKLVSDCSKYPTK